jgi:hypothetical protein
VFEPWVSLVQMARAYGQWHRRQDAPPGSLVHVRVYVTAPDVIALMNAGQLDLAAHLQDIPLRILVEVIDAFGRAERQHLVVDADSVLEELPAFDLATQAVPAVHATPAPGAADRPLPLDFVGWLRLRDFGLVSGSTLVVDYRPQSMAVAQAAAADLRQRIAEEEAGAAEDAGKGE